MIAGAAVAVAACAEFLLAPEIPPRTPHALHLDRQSLTLDDGQRDRLVATVLDQGGAPLDSLPAGLRVTWTSSADSVAAVDTGGGVSAAWPGAAAVTATLALPAGPLSISAAVTVRAIPTHLAASAGDSQAGIVGTRLARDFAVRLTERHGLAVAGDTVLFAISAGAGTLSADTVVTDAGGFAATALTADTLAGAVTVQARAARLPAVTARFSASIGPATPAAVRALAGDGQAGVPGDTLAERLLARVTDRFGNVIPGVAVNWAVTAGGGSVAPAAPVTDSLGRAAAVWTLGSAGAQAVRASVDTLSVTFTATAGIGAPAKLAFTTQPTATGAGQVIGPAVVVEVEDAAGNPVAAWGSPVSIAIGANPGGATLGGTLSQAAPAGTASFADLTVSAGGAGYTLVASSPGLASATSAAFDVVAPQTFWDATADFSTTANPNGAWTAGYTATLGSAMTVFPAFTTTTLELWYDPANFTIATPIFGKNVSGSPQFNVPPGKITLHPGCNANEYAQLRWTAPHAGSYLANVQLFAGDVGGTDGTVLVNDVQAFHTPTTDLDPGFSLFRTLAAGDRIDVAIGTAGDCHSDNTPLTFTVSEIGAVSLTANAPTSQTALAFTTVTSPSVVVKDGSGAPLAGVAVTFAITAGGGVLLGGTLTPVTDANGVATAGTWRLGLNPGQNTMTATLDGVGTVTFDATGTPPPPTALAFQAEPGPSTSGVAISPAVTVAALDATFQIYTAATGSVTLSLGQQPGGATLGGTLTQPLVNGIATFNDLVVTGPAGSGYALTASYPGVPDQGSASFALAGSAPGVASIDVVGADVVGLGRATPLLIRLNRPADPGGITVQVTSDAPGVVGVGTAALAVAAGDSVAYDTLAGVALGTTTVHAAIGAQPAQSLTVQTTDQVNAVVGDSLAAGAAHTCAIRAGTTYCWGWNGGGQLGDGSTTNHTDPVVVSGGLTFVAVTAGGQHTCALTTDGSAWCWGANNVGQLGNGTNTPSSTPVAVSGGLHFAQIKGNENGARTCGVTVGGALYCWGSLPFLSGSFSSPVAITGNQTWRNFDAVGNTNCGVTSAGTMLCLSGLGQLVRVANMPDTLLQASVGAAHICGLTSGGKPWCEGTSTYGQLGYGAMGSASSTANPVLGTETFVSLTSADQQNCGVVSTGAAFCWGWNLDGELGDGTTTSHVQPASVSGGLAFAVVKAGQGHTCGVTTANEVWCWGANNIGQLGDGTLSDRHVPVRIFPVAAPVALPDTFAMGRQHSCAIRAGVTYCWGWNVDGQLGDGTNTSHGTPAVAAAGFTFVAITAGQFHTCALKANGSAWCWGDDANGQLGNGPAGASRTPVAVAGGLSFTSIAADGSDHTCGITTAGDMYCWGSLTGTLGGTYDAPVLMSGGQTWTSVRVGFMGDCGVTTGGAMMCYGAGGALSPAPGMPNVTQGSVGLLHACGISIGGKPYCWGDNSYGGLGWGTVGVAAASADTVLGNERFTSIAAGWYTTCGLTTTGQIYCWGANNGGELGDGTSYGFDHLAPAPVAGGHTFIAVRIANGYAGQTACGMTNTGEIWCWGRNDLGQIDATGISPYWVPTKVF